MFDGDVAKNLERINNRNQLAKQYFYPVLKELSQNILKHIDALKDEKQVKAYMEELLELEGLLYKNIQQLDKVATVVENVLNNVEFSKEQLRQTVNQNERLELVKQSIFNTAKANDVEKTATRKKGSVKDKVKPVTESTKEPKEKKPDTKEASFALFKEGKTLFEIATERGFAITTIEGHLAYYVSLGMIPVSQFVAKEKYDVIVATSKKLSDEKALTPIKLELGEDYSYSEIRFALATLEHLKAE